MTPDKPLQRAVAQRDVLPRLHAIVQPPSLNTFVWIACTLAAASLLLACDPDFVVPEPGSLCTEAGEQCKLPDGPLGVCERSTCSDTEAPPCFQCVSQH